jgi:crotonobetainyl-CoA:carnitine CoA-transferase CaiB-like acyl-CoA transferase
VLDLTRLLPGNYCTWLLASLGAEVLKIEDPGAGDYMRSFGVQVDGQGATHQLVNRGKRSAVISLKHPEGVQVFHRLVAGADVLVSSFRPGVLERLGIGYEVLSGIRPSLVQAELTGFGSSGPLSRLAAHDLNCVGLSGFLDRTGRPGQRPAPPPIPLSDLTGGGLVPALGIVALVHAARESGRGARLESSLFEGLALLPNLVVADILAGGDVPGRGETEFGGGLACYDVYEVRDGFVTVAAVEEQFWRSLCDALSLPDLVEVQYDAGRQEEIRERLGDALAPLTRDEVEALFAEVDACVVPVRSYEELLTLPQAEARGLIRRDERLPMPVLAPPFVIDGDRPPESLPAPRHGEHTEDVLRELGLGPEEIHDLVERGAVGPAPQTVGA